MGGFEEREGLGGGVECDGCVEGVVVVDIKAGGEVGGVGGDDGDGHGGWKGAMEER